jgi:hypothetical protein
MKPFASQLASASAPTYANPINAIVVPSSTVEVRMAYHAKEVPGELPDITTSTTLSTIHLLKLVYHHQKNHPASSEQTANAPMD